MKLGDKVRYLREAEGTLRGFGRGMTQNEVIRAMKKELKRSISQSYLSQIESGHRQHLTNTTRQLLARFFKVHPGYLVDDPEGYQMELASEALVGDDQLDSWLREGAERFRSDDELSNTLALLAERRDTRRCVLLLGEIARTPDLLERLLAVLRPELAQAAGGSTS